MISNNSWYITMHYDRLNDELLENTYGKRIDESQKKKQNIKSSIQINNTNNDEIKEHLK